MGLDKLLPCSVRLARVIQQTGCDVLCVVDVQDRPADLVKQFNEYRSFDAAFDKSVSCFMSDQYKLPVVYAPVQELTDYHDVRSYQKAIAEAVKRALKGGFVSPMLVVPDSKRFSSAPLCSVLAALEQLYVPISVRENLPEREKLVKNLSVFIDRSDADEIMKEALILESGRFVARDIGGGDPERMAPPRIEDYIKPLFPMMQVTVISKPEELVKDYPLFAAVNRAANTVERHQGRIIFIEYAPLQKARKTIMLVGKGVTYDTGGADIKAGGVMAGMSRDKCGAAAVAGFMQVVNEIKPCDVHVIAALCLVRNSVGEESYVSDEIITSRAGVRVRVGNTDAEGRMCMADALCRMKEIAVREHLPDPHLYTVATLTGHAVISAGPGYSIVIDNSVAREADHARSLQIAGQSFGEPFEISTLRPDDFAFNEPQAPEEDLVQCNNLPSTRTPRGHQVPAAFMITAAGLDKYGLNSDYPIKYSHLDIAASAGDLPKSPTAAPIVALAKHHLL